MSEAVAPTKRALPRRLRLLILAAVALTGLAVFGAVEALHYSEGSSKPSMSTGTGFFRPRSSKPVAFSLASLSSRADTISMSQLLGRPVVLNLWASDCTVCSSETPAIESVARSMGGRVEFVGVDSADQRPAAVAFSRRYGVTYPEVFDPKAVVATGYGVSVLPVTFFVTAGGKVVGENIGALTAASLRHYLEMLFGV
jgi:thiol-disulfide isomerase/thioredoxin